VVAQFLINQLEQVSRWIQKRGEKLMKDRLLSVDDVCEYLGISRDTAYRWIEEKGLPAYRLGRLWKFKKQEIEEWVKRGADPKMRRKS